MIQISAHLSSKYKAFIGHKGVQTSAHQYYVKWLRFFLIFVIHTISCRMVKRAFPAFVEKLKVKKQTEEQRKQAHHAISLYYEMDRFFKNRSSSNPFKDNGMVRSQSLYNTPYPHTQQKEINQENQADDIMSHRTSEPFPGTQEGLKQTGTDWTKNFNDLSLGSLGVGPR